MGGVKPVLAGLGGGMSPLTNQRWASVPGSQRALLVWYLPPGASAQDEELLDQQWKANKSLSIRREVRPYHTWVQ